jgi:putative GTP pyrophosphokinase
MSKIEFLYTKGAVNRAGKALVAPLSEEKIEAKKILDNWRACHVAPLNSFQRSLRLKLNKLDDDALVSQRLKRTPSILSKLERNPNMQLARMQDIGGIRVVAKNMQKVREIKDAYKNGTNIFTLVSGGKDYINYPKDSGYRSVHMIFKCKNGFSIELQIRTIVQHAWATAIETMGTFLDHSLKSSEGPEEWLNFFSLASSAFAVLESTPRAPEHDQYSAKELFELLLAKENEFDVLNKLAGFRVAAKHITDDKKKGHYHLVTLNLDTKMANIQSYAPKNIEAANADYSAKEELVNNGENIQVVLVSSESITSLKKAYPSYFLDAQLFAKQIEVVKKSLLKLK